MTTTPASPASRFPSETPMNRNQCPHFDSGCRQRANELEAAANYYESNFRPAPPPPTTAPPARQPACPPFDSSCQRQERYRRAGSQWGGTMAPPTTVPYCPIGRPNYGARPNCPRAGDDPTSIMGGLRNIGSAIAKGAKATGGFISRNAEPITDGLCMAAGLGAGMAERARELDPAGGGLTAAAVDQVCDEALAFD